MNGCPLCFRFVRSILHKDETSFYIGVYEVMFYGVTFQNFVPYENLFYSRDFFDVIDSSVNKEELKH